jgi:hypothetical protein
MVGWFRHWARRTFCENPLTFFGPVLIWQIIFRLKGASGGSWFDSALAFFDLSFKSRWRDILINLAEGQK